MSKARELADLGSVTTRLDEVGNTDGALSNRNAVINGGFDVWQRGSPITNAGGGSYFSADRWKGYSGASRTFTRDTTSALSIGFKNCLKVVQGAAASSFYNRIEDVRTYAGDTVTLSYWVKADAAHTTSFSAFKQNFGSGGSADVTVNMSTVDIGTSWQRVVETVTLPSVEGKTIGSSSYLEVYPFLLSASQTYYITGVQLEVGDTATPFEHRSFGDELARCQRYYERSFSYGTALGTATSDGMEHFVCNNYNNGQVMYSHKMYYKVEKRVKPSLQWWTHYGNYNQWYQGVSGLSEAIHAAPIPFNIGTTGASLYMTTVASNANTFYGHYTADAEL